MKPQHVDQLLFIFGSFLAAEVCLPWSLIWLSDRLDLDVPTRAIWLSFGMPGALSLLACLSVLLPRPLCYRRRAVRKDVFIASAFVVIFAAASWYTPALASESTLGQLKVVVSNVRAGRGHVLIAVCTADTFLGRHCQYHASAPAQTGTVVAVVDRLPTGTYAVQAFQDENDSLEIKRTLLGIPEEGVGFSNDALPSFGPPRFTNAAFRMTPEGHRILLHLRYFN